MGAAACLAVLGGVPMACGYGPDHFTPAIEHCHEVTVGMSRAEVEELLEVAPGDSCTTSCGYDGGTNRCGNFAACYVDYDPDTNTVVAVHQFGPYHCGD